MSDVRYDVRLAQTGSKTTKRTPKLQSLPSTSETFSLNAERARIQSCIWKSALDENPPDLDPSKFGWTKDEKNKQLTPVTNSPQKKNASTGIYTPNDMLWVFFHTTMSNYKMWLLWAQISCSIFCKCHQKGHCDNRWTKAIVDVEDAEALSEHEDIDNHEQVIL